jgi:SprB repeat/Secretion system C-terminal sorting domain
LNATGGDIYTVTVTDANNCTDVTSVLIPEPLNISLISDHTNETNVNANDGTATVTAAGGTQPYTYLWSNNGDTQTIENLSAGIYQVTVTDANLCTSMTFIIVLTDSPTIAVTERIKDQIIVLPNPVTDFLLINCKDEKIDFGEIITPNGLKIKTLHDFDVNKSISVSELTKGVYFLKLITQEREVRILKFMKM